MCEINACKPLKWHENDIFSMLHPIYLLPTLYIKINLYVIGLQYATAAYH